jgi:predicted nucleic acid-binding protein
VSSPGVVLDAGLFIALERRDRVAVSLVDLFYKKRTPLVTSAGVVAQVWRGLRGQQVPVAFLLRQTEVVDLTYAVARVLGNMLGATRTSDPIDAHIALLARQRGWSVLTSDPDDLLAIDPKLEVERV